jgi:hypothetical protein
MARAPGNRLPYLVVGTGVLFVWAGLNNKSVLETLKDLIQGKQPQPGAILIPGPEIAGHGTPDPNINNPTDLPGIKGLAMAKLHGKGWDSQWDSFDKLITGESNWSPTVKNPSSGAFGLGQALNHGTAATNGTMSNAYGPQGISVDAARAANSGQAGPQLDWTIAYIAGRYGGPNNAYMTWLSRHPHWY